MYHTGAAYKEQVKRLPQNYRLRMHVVFDAEVEDMLETLQCENGAPLETEAGEVLQYPLQVAQTIDIPSDEDNDIFEAGFSENVFLNTFCVGSAVSAEFWARIFNRDGKYKNDALAKAEIHPYFTLYDADGNEVDTVPVGVFYVDKITVQDSDLRLGCVDKMYFLKKPFVPQGAETNLYEIAQRIARTVRSEFITTPMKLLTDSKGNSILLQKVNDNIFKGYSNKQVLECIAEVCGSFAVFNPDGNLELRWFKQTDVELYADWAKTALELNGNTFTPDGNVVQVTGVRIVSEDTELAIAGTDEYLLTIEENPIATVMPSIAAKAVLYRMQGMKYIPCKWERIGGDPSLQVGDILTIIDNKTTYNETDYENYDKYALYMTARRWTFNCGGFSDVYTSSGNAETDLNTDKGMTVSKRVSQLAKRVTDMREDILDDLDEREKFLLLFNETIAASMGYYTTDIIDENGARISYMHDKPTLEESQTIYTYGINGYAWTEDGWNDGNPVWNYGFSKNGNAILNQIYAYHLTADVIVSGLLKSKNGASWINLDDGTFCFRAIAGGLLDMETGEMVYTYKKVLELAEDVLNVYGTLRSTVYPNLSVSIGESEMGNFGAFTVTDSSVGYGDLFQVYGVTKGDENGAVWTTPFANNSKGTNRKGIAVYPNEFSIFNDDGYGRITMGHGSNYGAWISTYRNNINVSTSAENGHCWFNYYPVARGNNPNRYSFGNGNAGYADIYCGGLKAVDGQVVGTQVYAGDYVFSEGEMWAKKYNVTSDPSMKENIVEQSKIGTLEKLLEMKFYSYDFKKENAKSEDKPIHVECGVMATEAPSEIQSEDGKAIDLYSFIGFVAKAVQELSQKVSDLEERIAELEAENQALKRQ